MNTNDLSRVAAGRFAAIIAIAAVCLWVDHTTKVSAVAAHGWDLSSGIDAASWPRELTYNQDMPLPVQWYWPLLVVALMWVAWFGTTSCLLRHAIGAGLAVGGALGNAVQWWHAACVVDWIPIGSGDHFLMANFADMGLAVGFCLLVLGRPRKLPPVHVRPASY